MSNIFAEKRETKTILRDDQLLYNKYLTEQTSPFILQRKWTRPLKHLSEHDPCMGVCQLNYVERQIA
jgi:hypothetical protein